MKQYSQDSIIEEVKTDKNIVDIMTEIAQLEESIARKSEAVKEVNRIEEKDTSAEQKAHEQIMAISKAIGLK